MVVSMQTSQINGSYATGQISDLAIRARPIRTLKPRGRPISYIGSRAGVESRKCLFDSSLARWVLGRLWGVIFRDSHPAFVQRMRLQLRFEVIARISSDRYVPDCILSLCAGHSISAWVASLVEPKLRRSIQFRRPSHWLAL